MRELSVDEIEELTKPNDDPIIWFDIEMRCAERGCSSPTYLRLLGIPICIIHCVKRCNVMMKEKGIKTGTNIYTPGSPTNEDMFTGFYG